MNGRISDNGQMTHLVEVGPLTALMIDLRKQAKGMPFNPITEERLDEYTKAIWKITQCRHKALFK